MNTADKADRELEERLRDMGIEDQADIDTIFEALGDLEWREPVVAYGAYRVKSIEWADKELDRVEIDIPRKSLPDNLFSSRFRLQEIEDE